MDNFVPAALRKYFIYGLEVYSHVTVFEHVQFRGGRFTERLATHVEIDVNHQSSQQDSPLLYLIT